MDTLRPHLPHRAVNQTLTTPRPARRRLIHMPEVVLFGLCFLILWIGVIG